MTQPTFAQRALNTYLFMFFFLNAEGAEPEGAASKEGQNRMCMCVRIPLQLDLLFTL